jgi:hypothetical protein
VTDWKNPVAVAWYYRLKSREQRARNRAEGRCTECRVLIETRGVCEGCKARRRERYHQVASARLATDATLCLDCHRPCKVATSMQVSRVSLSTARAAPADEGTGRVDVNPRMGIGEGDRESRETTTATRPAPAGWTIEVRGGQDSGSFVHVRLEA